MSPRPKLKKLAIRCSNTDCANNLHCFRKSTKQPSQQDGQCQACGVQLVEWPRVHRRDLADSEHTLTSLKYEWIRHHYWTKPLSQRVIDHARRKGRQGLGVAVEKKITQSISKPKSLNAWDGRQTTFDETKETIITCGQHAVACCCRTCLEYWHGIPANSPLDHKQFEYIKALILMYIDQRMPGLQAEPARVARLTRSRRRSEDSSTSDNRTLQMLFPKAKD